jgi:hypothetical protein
MIINNQFFIFTYAGTEPLNLMEMPEEISSDNDKKLQYNKFIQSIDTIYSSQNIDNSIPVFWTKRSQLTDEFGNSSYAYVPHEDSTLTQLSSQSAYYVILRTTADLPIYVPIMGTIPGGSVGGGIGVIPVITNLSYKLLEDDYKTILNPTISGLQPYERYSYVYKGIDSNWPITIAPLSGTIKPSETSGNLSSIMSFCPTSGACCECVTNRNIISGVIPNTCPTYNESHLYSTFELEVIPLSFNGSSVKSNPVTIECKDCLPRVKVILQEGSSVINLGTNTSTVDITAHISGLEPTQNYNYEYVGLGANWPAMFITPISGTFTTYNSREFKLSSKIVFCPTSSLCPSNDSSVIDYVLDPKFVETYYSSLRLKVTPNTCAEPYYMFQGSNSVYSPSLTIYCNDCL